MDNWRGAGVPEDGTADTEGSSQGRYAAGTSEDVAALYTWANLQSERYLFAGVDDDPLYRMPGMRDDEKGRERISPSGGAVEESFAKRLCVQTELRPGSDRLLTWGLDGAGQEPEFDGPAWLSREPHEGVPSQIQVRPGFESPRVEARRPAPVHRWSALREVLDSEGMVPRSSRASISAGRRAPLLVVFSMAGGVGRTSLLATVGRALSSSGERVVLGDAAPYSLLPFFFGGSELRPGEVRRFSPAAGSGDSSIFVVNYDLAAAGSDSSEQKHLVGEILRGGAECDRILLDLPMGSEWLLRRLTTLQATVLVPLLPDLSSVVSIEAVERYFERFAGEDGNPVLPFYLLNQFEASQKLHLDVRDLLRARLGDRLLNPVVRRSTAVSEALAEGMTVAEYAPESAVAQDFLDLAVWLRTVSPPLVSGVPTTRSGRG